MKRFGHCKVGDHEAIARYDDGLKRGDLPKGLAWLDDHAIVGVNECSQLSTHSF